MSAGLINKFLFYNRTESYSECLGSGNRELISKSGNITNSFNYFIAASIEAGIDFSITDKIYTGLYPSFEYSFLNSNKNKNFKKHYYLIGLNINVLYKF